MDLTQESKDGALIFYFKGRLDSNTAQSTEKNLVDAITAGNKFLIFDLKNLEYLSSAGIRILVHCHKKIEHEHGKIFLTTVPKPIENVLYITGFLPYFQTFSDIDHALAAIAK